MSSLKLTSQNSLDETQLNNKTASTILDSSPKASKPRLAPIDLPNDKLKTSKLTKDQDSQLSVSNNGDFDQIEINWKAAIEPLLNLMNNYFRG